MEQTVTWTEDTWNSADDDHWYGADESQWKEFDAARQGAILTHKGLVLATCWTPFRDIVATVKCEDGQIRSVPTSELRSK